MAQQLKPPSLPYKKLKNKAKATTRHRHVLIATDGSAYSKYAFEFFMLNLYMQDDDLLFVFVHHDLFPKASKTPVQVNDPKFVEKLTEESEETLRAALGGMVDMVDCSRVRAHTRFLRVHHDNPAEGIIQASDKFKVDLIVTGTRGFGLEGKMRNLFPSQSDPSPHAQYPPRSASPCSSNAPGVLQNIIKRTVLGSVSMQIVTGANVPVMVVKR